MQPFGPDINQGRVNVTTKSKKKGKGTKAVAKEIGGLTPNAPLQHLRVKAG